MPAALDDPFYYLNNFQTVLNWVHSRYDHLLIDEERRFLDLFPALPLTSRALLVRMIMRKGSLFRAAKLQYEEIGSTAIAIHILCAQGWVNDDPLLTLEELFGLLTKAELGVLFKSRLNSSLSLQLHSSQKPQLAPQLKSPSALKKADWFAALSPHFPQPRRFADWCVGPDRNLVSTNNSACDAVYAVTVMPFCDRLRLMFFGNLHQHWNEFVLADLGLFHYEKVTLSTASWAFQQRDDIDHYLHLYRCREQFENAEPLTTVLAAIPHTPFVNTWLEARRTKLLFSIAQHCERIKDFAMALSLYQLLHQQNHYYGARLRCIRLLELSDRHAEALVLARTAENEPESEAELQQLLRILPRLHRRLSLPKIERRISTAAPIIELTLIKSAPYHSVEIAVQNHLTTPASPVYYVENTLLNSLLGLLCWQAIFAPLPGAFFHPFQNAPADLLSADFLSRRAALFNECLAQLDNEQYQNTILSNFVVNQGMQSPFVYWENLSATLLQQALACLPPQHLKVCFERMLRDIKNNRAGLPDLIQLWPAERRYRLIEVKGPGDRLQDNQLRWIEHCTQHAIPIAVCYVQWQDTAA